MKKYIYRQNNKFIIDRELLSSKANKDNICNAIYAAIYSEFSGASKNKAYSHLTYIERFNKLNEFVEKWLKDRGLE